MHTNSRLLFIKYALPLFKSGMKVCEIGPDAYPSTYAKCLPQDVNIVWHTLDIYENEKLTYSTSDPYNFDIPNDIYDIVVSGQVIEHVRKPWIWLKELARITAKNGLVITINPVSWYYHEAPVDCWRIYPEGMKALYEEANLTVSLSKWESLETDHFRRHIPGISREQQTFTKRLYYSLFGIVGFPVERSYDTITIGSKKS